jgi:hypothetical protein
MPCSLVGCYWYFGGTQDLLWTVVAQSVYCLTTDWTTGVHPRQRQRIFSSSLCVQTGSGAHLASYPMGTGGKAQSGVIQTTHPHLVPRPRISKSCTFSPLGAWMASSGTVLLFHHPWWWRQHVPLKRRSTIILHGSTSQKTILNFILAAVRAWNLTFLNFVLRLSGVFLADRSSIPMIEAICIVRP